MKETKSKRGSNYQLAAKSILNLNPWETTYETDFSKGKENANKCAMQNANKNGFEKGNLQYQNKRSIKLYFY